VWQEEGRPRRAGWFMQATGMFGGRVCTCSLTCRSCYAVNVGRRVHGVILNERTRRSCCIHRTCAAYYYTPGECSHVSSSDRDRVDLPFALAVTRFSAGQTTSTLACGGGAQRDDVDNLEESLGSSPSDGVAGIGTADGLLDLLLSAAGGTGGGPALPRFCSRARSLRKASDASDGVAGDFGLDVAAWRLADKAGELTAS
jgi:hypothetical protein